LKLAFFLNNKSKYIFYYVHICGFFIFVKKYPCASGESVTIIRTRRPTPRPSHSGRLFGRQGTIENLSPGDPIGDDVVIIEQDLIHHHKPAHAIGLAGKETTLFVPPAVDTRIRCCSGAIYAKVYFNFMPKIPNSKLKIPFNINPMTEKRPVKK
jgi:hypothetical protein